MTQRTFLSVSQRIRLISGALLVVVGIFILRAFYLQVIRHNYYEQQALKSQLKEYEIPAERGIIEAHDGDNVVPLVLNEKRYTLFADPAYVKDPLKSSQAIQQIIGGKVGDYETLMQTVGSRYAVLAKKLTKDQRDKIIALDLAGIGSQEITARTYPEGQLASQLLGFVNDDGQGSYGIEQALDAKLEGTPGKLKAITDARGVPLAANTDNVEIAPQAGQKTVLTIDIGLQQQVEDILKAGLDAAKSTSGSALILDVKTGAVKAMANYPTYSPAEFYKVTDQSLFTNPAVSSPLEVGSIMKPLTAGAALDLGAIKPDTTYFDPSHFEIDGYTIKNIEEDGGPGVRSLADILQLSLNTGATWMLMQMGGGQINQKARDAWHDYMVNHYQLGKPTGIEQGYEAPGTIPDPDNGYGLNLQYANTAFGQGMTATPLQMGAALASLLNGGTYYQPHLVDGYIDGGGTFQKKAPVVVKADVVKPAVSKTIVDLMEYVVQKNYLVYGMSKPPDSYRVGGKTGTAEIPKPGGGYYDDRYNGMFMGYVGGNQPQYVIVVRVNDPKIAGYAGSKAAGPIFGKLSAMMLNNFNVTPRQ